MLRRPLALILLVATPFACASVETPPDDIEEGTGGANQAGGRANAGGASPSGGRTSSGGTSSGGALVGSGGSSGLGGGVSAGGSGLGGGATAGGSVGAGGAAVGGAVGAGGASSGGAGGTPSAGGGPSGGSTSSGGQSGNCAGVPTLEVWKAGSDQQTGDEVMHQCRVIQAGCSGLKLKTDYLFECNQTHVPNCTTQAPEDGTSWTLIGPCVAGSGGASSGGAGSGGASSGGAISTGGLGAAGAP